MRLERDRQIQQRRIQFVWLLKNPINRLIRGVFIHAAAGVQRRHVFDMIRRVIFRHQADRFRLHTEIAVFRHQNHLPIRLLFRKQVGDVQNVVIGLLRAEIQRKVFMKFPLEFD